MAPIESRPTYREALSLKDIAALTLAYLATLKAWEDRTSREIGAELGVHRERVIASMVPAVSAGRVRCRTGWGDQRIYWRLAS